MTQPSGVIQALLHGGACTQPFEAVISGRSMGAALPEGSRVQVAPVSQEALRRDDIVLHKAVGGRIVAHRIVATGTTRGGTPFFITQGDAQTMCDTPIGPEEIIGKVTAVWKESGWAAPGAQVERPRGLRGLATKACIGAVAAWASVTNRDRRNWLSRNLMRFRS